MNFGDTASSLNERKKRKIKGYTIYSI
jgi:hypothetical protein